MDRGGRGRDRGRGQGKDRRRGRVSSDQPQGMDRGGRSGRDRGRGEDQGRCRGRGRVSSDQPQGPSPQEHMSHMPATVLAREMEALAISTSELPTVVGESSFNSMASTKESAEELSSPHMPSSYIFFGSIPSSILETKEETGSISMASTKESTEKLSSPHMPSCFVSSGSIPSPVLLTKEETGQGSRSGLVPVNRPDGGGKKAIRTIRVVVNHFLVKFVPDLKIYHYNFDIQKVNNGYAKRENDKLRPGKKEKEIKVRTVSKEDALEIKNNLLQEIKNNLLQENREDFDSATVAFDGEKNIYSVNCLPEGNYTVKLLKDEEKFVVALTYTEHELNRSSLVHFLDTNEKNHVELKADLLQALDLAMREHPRSNRFQVGRSLYPKQIEQDGDIGGGAVALRGFYQSLRPTTQGLVLNVDLSAIAFHRKISVIDYLRENCNVKCIKTRTLSEGDLLKAKKAIVGLKVNVIHRTCSQKFTVIGLTKQITTEIKIPMSVDNDAQNGMLDFFKKNYQRDILFKLLPCLDVSKSKDKPTYIPMELCVLCQGQRFPRDNLSGLQTRNFLRIACPSAGERQWRINEIMQSEDGPKEGPFLPHFGLEVVGNMTKVMGRVLEAPKLQLGQGGQVQQVTPVPETREWNLKRSHVLYGKRIEKWGLINFSGDKTSVNVVQTFAASLVRRCGKVGVSMNPAPLVCEYQPMSNFNDNKTLQQTLLNVHRKANGQLQILICVMQEKHEGYKTLKLIAETNIGLVTQCCLFKNVRKCSDQFLVSLALKINAKVGGSNAALFYRQLPRFGNDCIMYIGADVNHPGSKDNTSPSIAALVGSINWPWCNRYNAKLSYQAHRVEYIQQLKEMAKELLDDYLEANKKRPDRIIFFRDGVSESQFPTVLNEELFAFKEAVALFKDNYNPRVSFIVAQKRHHTRLFLGEGEHDRARSGNVPPGTVVDTVIVHPRQFDFYLCSHNGLLGTSKPTHYHVLWDENDFGSDELESLINNLCYTFARCTKPVSLVPPVYYADLAAYRGRLYLQGLPITPSESHLDFPKLHNDVKNAMYFC